MLNVPVLSRGRGGTGGHDFMSIKDNIKSLNFRISPINARGEFECRQVVFWETGIKWLGTPGLDRIERSQCTYTNFWLVCCTIMCTIMLYYNVYYNVYCDVIIVNDHTQ